MIAKDALISPCGEYRYWLSRQWDAALPLLCVVMLNPSTADAREDDHTITKLVEFGRRLGYGGFVVVNLYAYRATHPRDLKAAGLPIGPDNRTHIIDAVERCDFKVLCAWGGNAHNHKQEREVRNMLRAVGADTYALAVNKDGTPAHPLMLPYSSALLEFRL